MDAEKMFTASGSADTKLSAGILKHEDMKQENFHGWDAAEWVVNLSGIWIFYGYFFYRPGIIVTDHLFMC